MTLITDQCRAQIEPLNFPIQRPIEGDRSRIVHLLHVNAESPFPHIRIGRHRHIASKVQVGKQLIPRHFHGSLLIFHSITLILQIQTIQQRRLRGLFQRGIRLRHHDRGFRNAHGLVQRKPDPDPEPVQLQPVRFLQIRKR
ncbi:MAG: hypothetical protein D6695_10715 [Planctomycetota bacterium]|nr:MAG: hypothetical protein D6695_10715 [Planctomycetota bacterium]